MTLNDIKIRAAKVLKGFSPTKDLPVKSKDFNDLIDYLSERLTYKNYTATLAQTGTADPVATVLENTLGGTLVWTRVDAGVYRGTLAGAFPDPKKVVIFATPDGTRIIHAYGSNVNSILYVTEDADGIPSDSMNYYSIEIRVYN